jgi:hypothetical protein
MAFGLSLLCLPPDYRVSAGVLATSARLIDPGPVSDGFVEED